MKGKNYSKKALMAIFGALVGTINGLLGGGGGTLVVPLYQTLGELESRKAHATAIATILPLSVVSGIVYVIGGSFPTSEGLIVTVGVVIGGVIGALLLNRIKTVYLSLVFYGIMIYAGIKMIM